MTYTPKATNYTTKTSPQRTGDYRPRRGRIQPHGATSIGTPSGIYAITEEATENNLSSLFTLSILPPPWLAISRQFRFRYLHPFLRQQISSNLLTKLPYIVMQSHVLMQLTCLVDNFKHIIIIQLTINYSLQNYMINYTVIIR